MRFLVSDTLRYLRSHSGALHTIRALESPRCTEVSHSYTDFIKFDGNETRSDREYYRIVILIRMGVVNIEC